MTKKRINQYHLEGHKARLAGKTLADCPYGNPGVYPRACRKAWRRGWAGK